MLAMLLRLFLKNTFSFWVNLPFTLRRLFFSREQRVFLPVPILFAAEDEGRTEQPTERRWQKEREKGRVPKSPEIPAALVAIGGLIALFLSGSWFLTGLFSLIRRFVGNFSQLPAISEAELTPLLIFLIKETAILMAPLIIVVIIMGVAGNMAQTGLMFTLKPLQPDFKRIALTWDNFVKRVLFSRQVAMNLIKTIIKIAILAWVSYLIIAGDFTAVMKTGEMGVGESLRLLGFLAFKLALILAVVLFALSIPDYAYQRYEFIESIKMSRQDVKQEYKETEGDPLVKQRQRQVSHDLLKRGMLRKVPEANVVITNPTHYAVALRYEQGYSAPIVLAKGVDALALIIKNLAKRHEVPIIENKPLARELYAVVEEGDAVPSQFYQALAEIFSMLMKEGKVTV